MIQIIDLKKELKIGDVSQVVLDNINIHIAKGEYVSFYGPSGSGKTTLARIIGFLEKPSFGDYLFNGESVLSNAEKNWVQMRRDYVSFVFSDSKLIEDMTVFENVELPLIYQKIGKKERKERINQILKEYRIYHKKNAYPRDLTVMQRQLTSVSRAVISNPLMVIADEPTGHLNSTEGEEFLNILNVLNEKGVTVLLFTHSSEVANMGRKIIRLFDGHLVSEKKMQQKK